LALMLWAEFIIASLCSISLSIAMGVGVVDSFIH